jgi:hypothetical protein
LNLSIVFTYGHEQGLSESRGLENPGPKWRDIILVMKQEVDSQGITEEVPVDVLYDFFRNFHVFIFHVLIAGHVRPERSQVT